MPISLLVFRVVQEGKASAERVIVLPGEEFDSLIGRPGYHQRNNGDLERREGSFVYVMVRQGNRHYRWENRHYGPKRQNVPS